MTDDHPVTVGSLAYREWRPSRILAPYVRSFFAFETPSNSLRAGARFQPACAALFADAGMSIVFDSARTWAVETLWTPATVRTCGHVVGPITRGAATSFGERVDAVGAYLRAGYGAELLGIPASELADRIVPLAELWGSKGVDLGEAIRHATSVARRVELLESALLRRLRLGRPDGDRLMMELMGAVESEETRPYVVALANVAGLSRQHLTRRFRNAVGVAPKVFLRLARFRRLVRAAGRARWADLAVSCGYADQSHLIAEWREFTGLTPAALAATDAFHPFMSSPH